MKYLIIILILLIIYAFKKDTDIDKAIEHGEKSFLQNLLDDPDDD